MRGKEEQKKRDALHASIRLHGRRTQEEEEEKNISIRLDVFYCSLPFCT